MAPSSDPLLPRIGVAAFFLGLLLCVLAGFILPSNSDVAFVLGVWGILVGLLNVTDKKSTAYLVATVAFLIAAASLEDLLALDLYFRVGGLLVPVVRYLIAFVAPGTALVALRVLYDVAKQ